MKFQTDGQVNWEAWRSILAFQTRQLKMIYTYNSCKANLKYLFKKLICVASGQDGGVDRHTVHNQKKDNMLKTKNNQN